MSTFLIRPASAEDAGHIASIHSQAWPEDSPDEGRIAGALQQPGNRAHITFYNGVPAGFVDGFATRSLQGQMRWELDLLAVVPALQGKGCGRALARASLLDGRQAGAGLARALIQEGNLASQAALEQAGFSAVPGWHGLWTADCAGRVPPSLKPFAIPVKSFHYTGWWLEGEPGPGAFRKAAPYISQPGPCLLGTLLPMEESARIQAVQGAGFVLRGVYGWVCQFLQG